MINKMIKEDYSLEKKKSDIVELKRCAKYYKKYLLGKRFLVLFNNAQYIEIIFSKDKFKHLTGISSKINARDFYDLCIGKKNKNGKSKRYISPIDIYTTNKHPRILALKKFKIFDQLHKIFSEASYVLEEIESETRIYKFGLSNIQLTLLCQNFQQANPCLSPISLRSMSFISTSTNFFPSECSFLKKNSYMKYCIMTYPNNIDFDYFKKYNEILKEIINYNNIKSVNIEDADNEIQKLGQD